MSNRIVLSPEEFERFTQRVKDMAERAKDPFESSNLLGMNLAKIRTKVASMAARKRESNK